jgi:hypothetical protein
LTDQIAGKDFVIEIKKTEMKSEYEVLRNLNEQYKDIVIKKAEYIHPMIY